MASTSTTSRACHPAASDAPHPESAHQPHTHHIGALQEHFESLLRDVARLSASLAAAEAERDAAVAGTHAMRAWIGEASRLMNNFLRWKAQFQERFAQIERERDASMGEAEVLRRERDELREELRCKTLSYFEVCAKHGQLVEQGEGWKRDLRLSQEANDELARQRDAAVAQNASLQATLLAEQQVTESLRYELVASKEALLIRTQAHDGQSIDMAAELHRSRAKGQHLEARLERAETTIAGFMHERDRASTQLRRLGEDNRQLQERVLAQDSLLDRSVDAAVDWAHEVADSRRKMARGKASGLVSRAKRKSLSATARKYISG
uniref:Uncharacterized protein n=1 Tax=Mycena chlorophos TaxID=658473 RepID=A0ABQ0LTD5_MYCCL|nr:predicted protein [Mycena chlorophos]